MVATDLQESGHSAELRDSPATTLALDDTLAASSSSVAAPTVDQVSRAQKLDLKEWSISAAYKYFSIFLNGLVQEQRQLTLIFKNKY